MINHDNNHDNHNNKVPGVPPAVVPAVPAVKPAGFATKSCAPNELVPYLKLNKHDNIHDINTQHTLIIS